MLVYAWPGQYPLPWVRQDTMISCLLRQTGTEPIPTPHGELICGPALFSEPGR
jgi:hypothetical protein